MAMVTVSMAGQELSLMATTFPQGSDIAKPGAGDSEYGSRSRVP